VTGNAQPEQPFGGAARLQTWVMRSLSPWIRRMAAGPASRATSPAISTRNTIGAQISRDAKWISRRAERIERAAAWNGELGAVSPALVDRFSQRVAERVQRSTRSHQVDAYSGGDNLDSQLDMPLVSNEGSLTPLSEGSGNDTPFAFGAFSPEHVQRKPVLPQAEAPAAPPPMSAALRERAEQLRRSLATNTPAPVLNPSPKTPAMPASRAPAVPTTTPAAPRIMRARPTTRIEEIGVGKAPPPAPAMPPVPEPPKPSPAQMQQAPSPRPTPTAALPTPNVQRTALPPQVVQGQGRLTQMLNARFKPKLDEARNPDAPSAAASDRDDFSGDAGTPGSTAPAANISRSALPPADNDLTPRAPVRRVPVEDASAINVDAPAEMPVPTPKPRVLRKPALPASTPPKPATVPAVQRTVDAPSAPSTQRPLPTMTPAMPTVQRVTQNEASSQSEASAPSAPAAQRKADAPSAPSTQSPLPAVQRVAQDEAPSQPEASAPQAPLDAAASQREQTQKSEPAVALPLAAPAQLPAANPNNDAALPASPDAPVQRKPHGESASPAPQGAFAQPNAPVTSETIQRSTLPATTALQQAETPATPAHPISDAPADLTLRKPQSAPAEDASPPETVQHTATTEARTDATLQPHGKSSITQEAPAPIQRMTVNAPPAVALAETPADAAATDAAMPLAQRAPAMSDGNADADVDANIDSGAGADAKPLATPAMQRTVVSTPPETVNVDVASSDVDMPLVQRAPALTDDRGDTHAPADAAQPATPSAQATPAVQHEMASASQQSSTASSIARSVGVIQHAPAALPQIADEALPLQTPGAREADVPAVDAASPAVQRQMDRSATTATRTPVDVGATVLKRSGEMVLRSPAVHEADATGVIRDTSIVHRQPSTVKTDAPASVQRKAGSKSLQRAAGVALADMPVLRAATREAGDGIAPETRALSMPIVQRAAVKQERQAAQAVQERPVNPYMVAKARAEAMPVVQRAPANDAPEVQRALVEVDAAASAATTKSTQQAPAESRAISEAELTQAAQRILPIIKRLLAVERERLFGR
jgi:hypothetical protein